MPWERGVLSAAQAGLGKGPRLRAGTVSIGSLSGPVAPFRATGSRARAGRRLAVFGVWSREHTLSVSQRPLLLAEALGLFVRLLGGLGAVGDQHASAQPGPAFTITGLEQASLGAVCFGTLLGGRRGGALEVDCIAPRAVMVEEGGGLVGVLQRIAVKG